MRWLTGSVKSICMNGVKCPSTTQIEWINMNMLRTAVLAIVVAAMGSGSANAQTKQYFAREVLVPGTGGPAAEQPETAAPPVDQKTVYNQFDGPSAKSVTFNSCSFSTVDAASPSSANFTTAAAAKDWCTTIKVKYPSTKSMYMMCTISMHNGYYIAGASSGTCAHTLSGGAVGSDGVGRYSMVAIPNAY